MTFILNLKQPFVLNRVLKLGLKNNIPKVLFFPSFLFLSGLLLILIAAFTHLDKSRYLVLKCIVLLSNRLFI
jgi:hypothetical protein